MLEKIKFVNHIQEEMSWGEYGIYVNSNDLHDYSWDFTSDNNKISSFNKGIVTKTIPIIICCSSETEGLMLKNKLLEITEKDVLALEHGRIVIGDYYLKCYVTGSKKSNYLLNKNYMETSLTVATDRPHWVKETLTSFHKNGSVFSDGSESEENTSGKRNLDFQVDFPYDYMSEMKGKTLNNTGFTGVNFRLVIYGAAINPEIFIGGHGYQVNCHIEENEYLTIDSIAKTILLTKRDGTIENHFHQRSRDSYIFEKIPPGDNMVNWNKTFGFDVVLFEERSEPKWI